MNKRVIYTSLTNNYDRLLKFDAISPDFDYICFTNDYNPDSKIGQWIIKPIPYAHDNCTRLSRFVKLLPHVVLKEYEWSVWLDANITIREQSFYDIILNHINENHLWAGVDHPEFDCIYDDAKKCLRIGKANFSDIKKHIKFLREHNYPRHAGLFENNIILRKHNDPKIIAIDKQWWDFFNNSVPRDQLSLFYLFKRNNFYPSLLLPKGENARNSECVKCKEHTQLKGKKLFFLRLKEIKNRILIKITSLFNF